MKNEDLIRKFAQGAKSGHVGHLTIDGDSLINYWTVIARRDGDGVALNSRKYSSTTSRIQGLIRRVCNVTSEFVGSEI